MLKHVHAPQVFTTCGSAAKRAFLQKTFPWLEDSHIGDSRSTSFEATVLGQACHHGVACTPWGAPAPRTLIKTGNMRGGTGCKHGCCAWLSASCLSWAHEAPYC